MVINGEIQHIQNYQCPYHELLVHLPASFIVEPQTALIIGGGSLFAAYELLKYLSIKSVFLCDFDSTILQLMKKYYSHAREVMNNPRFHFIEQEGIDFILNCTNQYDLIINDCFNLLAMSKQLNISLYSMRQKN
ncbi:MAG: spermidine synthase [Lachnospiraceae bacterium]